MRGRSTLKELRCGGEQDRGLDTAAQIASVFEGKCAPVALRPANKRVTLLVSTPICTLAPMRPTSPSRPLLTLVLLAASAAGISACEQTAKPQKTQEASPSAGRPPLSRPYAPLPNAPVSKSAVNVGGLANHEGTLVAAGRREGGVDRTYFSFSTDGGATFGPASLPNGDGGDPLKPTLVAGGTKGWLAMDPLNHVLWMSADGKEWKKLASPKGLDQDATFKGMAVGRDGFILAGQVGSPGDEQHRGAIWRSPDGVQWTDVTLPDGQASIVGKVVAGHGALVAVGQKTLDGSNHGLAWTSSDDGVTWVSAPVARAQGNDRPRWWLEEVVVTPTGFIAIGTDAKRGEAQRPVICSTPLPVATLTCQNGPTDLKGPNVRGHQFRPVGSFNYLTTRSDAGFSFTVQRESGGQWEPVTFADGTNPTSLKDITGLQGSGSSLILSASVVGPNGSMSPRTWRSSEGGPFTPSEFGDVGNRPPLWTTGFTRWHDADWMVGTSGYEPAVWRLPNGGNPAPPIALSGANQVTALDARSSQEAMLVVGYHKDDWKTTLWMTTDGSTFSQAVNMSFPDGEGFRYHDLLRVGGRWVLFGDTVSKNVTKAVTMVSADGLSWSPGPAMNSLFVGPVTAAASDEKTAVIAGQEKEAKLGVTTDGLTWQPKAIPPPDGATRIKVLDMSVEGSTVIAAAAVDMGDKTVIRVAHSRDGATTWTWDPGAELQEATSDIRLHRTNTGYQVLSNVTKGRRRPKLWVSSDGVTWKETPVRDQAFDDPDADVNCRIAGTDPSLQCTVDGPTDERTGFVTVRQG